jgi:WD40 repeat protein
MISQHFCLFLFVQILFFANIYAASFPLSRPLIAQENVRFAFNVSNGGHTDYIRILLELENGLLASGSWDETIKIWDPIQGKLKYTFGKSNGGHTDKVYCLALLENGYLASGSFDKTVKIWDITQGKLKFTFDSTNGGHSSPV